MKPIPFKSYGQAQQDRLVFELIVKPEQKFDGKFLDIGCCHPTEISNTYALELLGWRGLMIDNDPGAVALCKEKRLSHVVQADSTNFKWIDEFGVRFDYLSLDVDAATLPTLIKMPLDKMRFRVMTIEHDVYRFGDTPRTMMRDILKTHGYHLLCADVCSSDGIPYEDWWVDPASIPADRYARFRCEGKKWTEIFPS